MTDPELRLVNPCVFGYVPLHEGRLYDLGAGLPLEEAADTYFRMFERGDLLAFHDRDCPDLNDIFEFRGNELHLYPTHTCAFRPTRKQLADGLRMRPPGAQFGYVFSPQGAERWQAATHAAWDRFLDVIQHSVTDTRLEWELRGSEERV